MHWFDFSAQRCVYFPVDLLLPQQLIHWKGNWQNAPLCNALQCDVILIKIINIRQILFHRYLSDPHLLLMKSKSLIVGPHLSGLESLGQTVTVGKDNSSIGQVNVSSTVTMGLLYHAKNQKYSPIRLLLFSQFHQLNNIPQLHT